MKSARELRIGNIVKCKISNDAGYYTITVIDGIHGKVMLSMPRNGVWIPVEKCKPIAITEEILLKLGFDKDYKKGFIGIDCMGTNWVLDEPTEYCNYYSWHIKQGNVPLRMELK